MNYRYPVRTLSYFSIAIVGTLLLAAVLVYPVYLGLHALNPAWPFHKIASRLWLALVVAAATFVAVRLGLTRREDWGYGVPRAVFLRDLRWGFVAGLVSMLPVAAMLVLLGVRPPAAVGSARIIHLLISGLTSGFAVGFVEETLFRGLLQGAVLRDFRPGRAARLTGVVLVALLYSALHFLARVTIPPAEVDASSGLRLLAAVGNDFAHFGAIADSFLALAAVGLLLGLARLYTGSIGLGVGLHAGWVLVMRVVVGATHETHGEPLSWLVSGSDGFTGWLVLGWTLLLLIALAAGWRPYRRPARAA